ncbi:hypothetical protein C8Q75DRAFT_765991 [Abortiporus biennis]|nr:hypothetical protein C8Q75DRAFT_765991 [Abortiporus biennis]
MDCPQNLSTWKQLDDPAWSNFHATWWGTTHLQETLDSNERVMQVFPDAQAQDLHLTFETRGQLYIRDEYKFLYNKLEAVEAVWMHGVLLSGQPGIGKSYFLAFALIKRMASKSVTMFSNVQGRTYLFHESGIFVTYTTDIDEEFESITKMQSQNSTRWWSLIDPERGNKSPPKQVRTSHSFIVYATSPIEQRYKEWRNSKSTPILFINLWSEEELSIALPLCFKNNKLPQDFHLKQSIFLCGRCPRDIMSCTLEPQYWHQEVSNALTQFKTLEDLLNSANLTAWQKCSDISAVAPLILISRKASSEHANHILDNCDALDIQFRSQYIAELYIRERLSNDRNNWTYADYFYKARSHHHYT